MDDLPFSQACENNKQPIYEVLSRHLQGTERLLEIGGGTAQHAEYFSKLFPGVAWQSSEIPANLETLNQRIDRAGLPNLPSGIALDVNDDSWPVEKFDAIFSANTLHIMASVSVVSFFYKAGAHLGETGLLLVYGPFKYGGEFTTPSNKNFDLWLKQRDPVSGIRDFEWVNSMAEGQGLRLEEDNAMPANNQLLVWKRCKSS